MLKILFRRFFFGNPSKISYLIATLFINSAKKCDIDLNILGAWISL
jgi:hypothetical protein